MDLKFYHGKIILHLIDHVSRLSSGCRLTSKEPKVVVKGIFDSWIKHNGCPVKFLTDNGGEFMNGEFFELCQQMNITVKTTAAESPWSNGMVERHNLILEEMLNKVLDGGVCDFDTALAWCFNAKNSLLNVNGYSPYQIARGKNPRLPSVSWDQPPSFGRSTSEIVRQNMDAIHAAKRAFIEADSSDKIKRALSHNTRTSNGIKFVTGDSVYYKRKDSKEWKGPGSVIGQDGQQILVKHGSYYVRVHPCRLMLKNECNSELDKILPENSPPVDVDVNSSSGSSNTIDSLELDSESDSEDGLADNAIASPMSVVTRLEESENLPVPNGSVHAMETSEALVDCMNSETQVDSPILKIGTLIDVKSLPENEWQSMKVISRAGKKSGKYTNSWNVENRSSGIRSYVDLDRVDWKFDLVDDHSKNDVQNECSVSGDSHSEDVPEVSRNQEECFLSKVVKDVCEEDISRAKYVELESWRSNNVYEEVVNAKQDCMSVRWVVTPKLVDDKLVCKARLCARGFEEQSTFRKDSPTCSKESIRLLLTVIASKSWTINALDIKSAFLQGNEIDRVIYIKPPVEARTVNVWKLRKCVYGLADAPRQWYIKLRDKLLSLGVSLSKHDDGLFFCRKGTELIGMLSCHVDDIIWGGTAQFKRDVIDEICQTFEISRECSNAFRYLGVNVSQRSDRSIVIDQSCYVSGLSLIEVSAHMLANKERPLSDKELSTLRSTIGQLNWLSCMTRPDISFEISVASSNVKNATVNDILHVNKVISKVNCFNTRIVFPCLDLDSLEICGYGDASYNNLKNAGSQGGYLIFLRDKSGKCCPLEWKSNRVKRVVRSALAAEALACADCVETSVLWQNVISEVLGKSVSSKCHTDSKSLYDNLNSKKYVSDRLLRVDINVIKENINSSNLSMQWIDTKQNLSDLLTKSGVCSKKLLSILCNGKLL